MTARRRTSAPSQATLLDADDSASRARRLIHWPEVIEALQNPNTEMEFSDLTGLTHVCLARLQRTIDAEAYATISRRAKNQGVSTSAVSLRT